MSPFVLAIANRKGGTGKTTTAVNLAVGFARRGLRTLLVDFDTQGHAGLGLDIVAAKGEITAHDIFERGADALASAIRPTCEPHLSVAPAKLQIRHPGSDVSPRLLAEALDIVGRSEQYDIVLIDTPPSLDSLLVTALTAADGVVIPFLPHPLAAEGVKQFARLFFEVRLSGNPKLKFVALTPIQVNANIVIHRRIIDGIRQQFGAHRVTSAIRPDIKLVEAFEKRQSIFDYAPSSRGASDYAKLTDELCSLLREHEDGLGLPVGSV